MLLSLPVRWPQVRQSAAGSSLHWLMKRRCKGGVQRNVFQCLEESCSLCESMQSIRNRHSRANGWKMKTITQWHHRGGEWSTSMTQQCAMSTPPAGWCDLWDRVGFGTSDAHSLIFLDILQFSWCFLWVSKHKWAQKSTPYNKIKTLYYFLMSSSAAMKRLILGVM